MGPRSGAPDGVYDSKNEMNQTNGHSVLDGKPHVSEFELETTDGDHRCGFGACRPGWVQICNNAKFLLVLLSAFSFIQSFVVNGINNVNTSTYERRFGLPSSQVGIISSAYDISAGILVLPISYYALRGHKTKMLAIGVAVMALGSFLMSIPHFTTDIYHWGQNTTGLCDTANKTTCAIRDSSLSNYLYLLIAGQLLHGVGGTTLYSVGTSCLDDNVVAKRSPIYVGIMYAFAALGPALGYILGGQLLNIYVDFDAVDTKKVPLVPEDPRWVGAWWIGFVISTILALIMFVPLLAMPRELPGAKVVRESRVSEAHEDGSEEKTRRPGFGTSLKDAPLVFWIIIKNPTFLLTTLAASTEGIVVSGFATFVPKFIQNQYGQTASFAAVLTGCLAVPGAAGGQVIGGWICGRFKLKVRGMLRLSVVMCGICMLLSAAFWAKCEQPRIAGLSSKSSEPMLVDQCNGACGCTQTNYDPVCGSNGVQYFSPCHAGCLQEEWTNDGTKLYSSCDCINGTFPNVTHSAVPGNCGETCSAMYVFLPFFFLMILVTFIAATPTTIVTLRCVPENQKTFALGVQWVFVRFLGTVPGPILFGAVIDGVCLIWKETCGEKESCWIYNNSDMGRNLFILALGVKIASSLFFLLASFVYRAPSGDKMIKTSTEETLAVEIIQNGVDSNGSLVKEEPIRDSDESINGVVNRL
ncbi:solute carrier organic anion transporter family member 4C1-like [Liolophura sinensis]|uniref:solute carrier organic anion transporter family member 4C1-like n=1 Tax=Liolophura sinensis TaxID=3198878 RepID=UPI00315806A2